MVFIKRESFFSAAITFILFLSPLLSLSQNKAVVFGTVKDENNKTLPGVNISVFGSAGGVASDENGEFELSVPPDTSLTIVFSSIGFETEKITVRLYAGERKDMSRVMKESLTILPPIDIVQQKDRPKFNFITIDPKEIRNIPSPSGNFEIKSIGLGVSSVNELSSQYNVRGGNFDENLVYVNGIEIYRPFLVRSGTQEGLSFINGDLVSGVQFSAGGFDAEYGDKLSSVLDIKYRKPTKFAATAGLSLLGGNLHLEGINKNKKITYLLGVRQKSNQYLLNSLETKGEYKPSFTDVQSLVAYQITKKTELSFLGNYSRNNYLTVPANRETQFGTVNEALQLRVYFDGREVDRFNSGMGALTLSYQATDSLQFKFIGSAIRSIESQYYDIQGQYYIDQLENDLGSSDFGNAVFNRGVGTYLEHARNEIDAAIFNLEHKGYLDKKNNHIQWGIKFQHEDISDNIEQWKYVDSADFSLPLVPEDVIILNDVLKTKNDLSSNRYSGFIQDTWTPGDSSRFTLAAGIRANYWDLNQQFFLTPRLSAGIKPRWKKNIVFKIAAGMYYQPPFYRELRNLEGKLNKDLKAQQSYHFVAGTDYTFLSWGRELKFTSEIFFKYLDKLVPYKVDNLLITYYGTNSSRGYAAGVDFRINGEFVPGAESWGSISLLKTQEDITGDYYFDYYNQKGEKIITGFTSDNVAVDSVKHEPGYLSRPTDQRLNFSIFFQDYLPKFPSWKMNLMLVYGTGLPFGPPGYDRYKDKFRYPPYRRVDIGFSKIFLDEDQKNNSRFKIIRHVKYFSMGLEVFNLLQVNNTISYLWVEDVTGRTYAVPNYLSARLLNVRLDLRF